MHKIGIADTTFARVDMVKFALDALKGKEAIIERYTVPGIKDLPVACKKLFDEYNCDIILALGMPGRLPIDKQCSHEASMGIQQVQLLANKHILEVFVHEDEGRDEEDLYSIFKDRTTKHTLNALALLKGKEALQERAGTGRRQGRQDVGEIRCE